MPTGRTRPARLRQGKLFTSTFTIVCPYCGNRQLSAGGSHAFRASEVRAGQQLACTSEGCGRAFKLPPSLTAAAKPCA